MLHLAVGDQYRDLFVSKRNRLYFLTHAIEQHKLTRHTENTGELIHDSTGHASKSMLGMLTEKCFFQWLYLVTRDALKHSRRCHFQSRTARQSTTAWNTGTDYGFQRGDVTTT